MVTRASKRYSELEIPSWQVWENSEMIRQNEMRKKGRDPIAITHSDPVKYGFTNQEISKYLIEAAEKAVHSYSSPRQELVNSICMWEKRYRNVDYSPDDIITTPGVARARAQLIWIQTTTCFYIGERGLTIITMNTANTIKRW